MFDTVAIASFLAVAACVVLIGLIGFKVARLIRESDSEKDSGR